MITNYLKIAWRNIAKSKLFSAINVFGLSVGMACCMLLLIYIRSELSFDRHHQFAQDIYLLRSENIQSNGDKMDNPRAPAPYAAAVKMEFPEVVQSARLWQNFFEDRTLFTIEGVRQKQSFYETKGIHVDSTFLDVLSYDFIEGDPRTALDDPHSVVLCRDLARKLFGNGSALNKTIRIGGKSGNNETYIVTGVYEEQGNHSHIDARYMLSIHTGWVGNYLKQSDLNFTDNNMFYTYLRLKQGTDKDIFAGKLPVFIEKYARKDLNKAGYDKKLGLLPVADVHLFSTIDKIVTPTSSKTYLYVLGCIAVFILLIACINFMNLATAGSVKRAGEVGIRKVMGAARGALIGQFLGESMLLTILAFGLALVMVSFGLPAFNQLADKNLQDSELFHPEILGSFFGLALVTGLLAGSYPAFYLSVYNPIDVVKGRFANSISATTLRRGLVVFQFVISIGLVVATTVIQGQIRFMRDQPLGFQKDQQVVIPFRSEASRNTYYALRNDLLQNSLIFGASGTSYYPGILNPSDMSVFLPGQGADRDQLVKTNWVAPDFMKTMGFELMAGRMFSSSFPADTNYKVVVNEATLRKLSIPLDAAIGQKLHFGQSKDGNENAVQIVGVVKDFHFQGLRQAIEPYAFFLSSDSKYNYLIAHFNTTDIESLLSFLESRWKSLNPDEPFTYSFLDDDFQKNYAAEKRTSRIVNSFTVISILISCLGLFGLAAFAAQQRIKEIGVRKVLGASISNIVGLLSYDFVKLVAIALIVATPLTWYVMTLWLKDFAYKINIEWWMFAGAGSVALLIALATVSAQAIKAAVANPVKSLRSE